MTDINHDNTVYPSSSFSGSPYLYQQVYTSSPDTRLTQINLLSVSKAYLFAALYDTNDIFSRNTAKSYTAITGRSPSPRYLRHVNSVLQATAVSLAKVLKDRGDFTWWDYNDKCLS